MGPYVHFGFSSFFSFFIFNLSGSGWVKLFLIMGPYNLGYFGFSRWADQIQKGMQTK